ncbi:MAG: DNA translocase FtsK [Ruminococcus sp.]|nr:DNA translocase FtsK [Ruminococcus sp.]
MSANKQTAKQSENRKSKSPASNGRGKEKTASAPQQNGLSTRVKTWLLAAAAVIFCIIIFVKGESIYTMFRGFLFGVFGFGIFLIPALLIYIAVINEKEKQIAHFKLKVVMCVAIILLTGALMYLGSGGPYTDIGFLECMKNLYLDCYRSEAYIPFGCGITGGIFGFIFSLACGDLAGFLIALAIDLLLIFLVGNLSVHDVGRAASRVKRASIERARAYREKHEAKLTRDQYNDGYSNTDVVTPSYNNTTLIDVPLDDDKSKKKRKKKLSDGIDIDYAETDEQNATEKDLSEELINIINRASKPFGESSDSAVSDIAEGISKEKNSNYKEDGAKQADPQTVPVEQSGKKRRKKSEDIETPDELENAGYSVDGSDNEPKEEKIYSYPPIQLLSMPENNNDRNAMEEMHNNAKKLIDTLKSFGVSASIVNICRGPSVTRYELQPAPGVKISKITNLSDDIALNLAANGVRIEAPIPGKAAVGIEVPNKVVSMVSMRELIDSEKFRTAKSKLTTVLGRDISGDIVVADLAKMPHLLIAGTTGSGKSVCVNSILMSILFKATPDEVKLLLIDPKMVEFSKYKGIPHLLIPVVSDAKKAAGALSWAVNEMLTRYKIFSEYDCKDIDSYNSLIEKNLEYISQNPPVENEEGEMIQPVMEVNGLPVAKEKMSRVVIAIDELADLMMAAPSEVEDSICRLAQMARAAGMHLILATQRPTVNVITGLIKANVPSRISLKVSSNMDSRTILDVGGGEKLIGRGDMLFSPVGAPKPVRVQGCYASDEEIEGVTRYIKKSFSAQYNAEIEEQIKRIAAEEIATGKKGSSNGGEDEDSFDVDAKMDEAIRCVIDAGQASTSLLQRRLKVGYARAGRMIDDMEQMGVVGPHQGSKPRDVLMTYNEWLERRNILSNSD